MLLLTHILVYVAWRTVDVQIVLYVCMYVFNCVCSYNYVIHTPLVEISLYS